MQPGIRRSTRAADRRRRPNVASLHFNLTGRIRISLLVVPGVLDLPKQQGRIIDAEIDAETVALCGSPGPGPAWLASKIPPKMDSRSVMLTSSLAPIAAKGGDGPPLGKSRDVMAGQPKDALVNTSVYLVLKNSLSAASWPNLNVTVLAPHCFSK